MSKLASPYFENCRRVESLAHQQTVNDPREVSQDRGASARNYLSRPCISVIAKDEKFLIWVSSLVYTHLPSLY
jgi:hypothetical protein